MGHSRQIGRTRYSLVRSRQPGPAFFRLSPSLRRRFAQLRRDASTFLKDPGPLVIIVRRVINQREWTTITRRVRKQNAANVVLHIKTGS